MSMRTLAIAAIALWVMTIAVAAFFLLHGLTEKSKDGRTAVLLSPVERDLVLTEMRANLGAVQGVFAAALHHDMKRVSEAAKAGGMAAAADVTPSLLARLPMDFKSLGFAMHGRFDEMAAAADRGATPDQILSLLNTQLESCIACHAIYRLP